MPLRHRHAYAAVLRRGLPTGDINRRGSSPHSAGARRGPAQIRQVRAGGIRLRGVPPLAPRVNLPVLLAGPGPSDGAGPSRLCRGCLPPGWRVPAHPAAPSFTGLLRQAGGGVLSPPHGTRAPRGARSPPPRSHPVPPAVAAQVSVRLPASCASWSGWRGQGSV